MLPAMANLRRSDKKILGLSADVRLAGDSGMICLGNASRGTISVAS
jgi:hypothetical protein